MAIKTYQDSKDKYLREKVDTFVLRVPKGKKQEIAEYAASKGMSLNSYITSLVFLDMGDTIVQKETKKETKPKAPTKKSTPKPKAQPKQEKKIEKGIEPIVEQQEVETPKRRNMPSFLL